MRKLMRSAAIPRASISFVQQCASHDNQVQLHGILIAQIDPQLFTSLDIAPTRSWASGLTRWQPRNSQREIVMPEKLRRGFASMDLEKRRTIASKGGKAAHEKGRAHEFTSEEAREAGRKGGHAAHERGTAHQF